ncbi:MAG: hypothetical protein NUV60_02960 [Patescibacteria group bacterium]|nr:hypothetical protein [Patescibacteria group bacterium]
MSFFNGLFHKKKKEDSVILIDISADSIAGAYVRYSADELPVLLYTNRVPIDIRGEEPHEHAMLRALDILGNGLIREGAPILVRSTGSGSADTILVSIDAPWQKTFIRTERFEQEEPFIFTESLVWKALEKTRFVPKGQQLADESIIGTVLNGYKTSNPYGKETHHASVIVLTSLVDELVVGNIKATLRALFHTQEMSVIAGSSLRYQAIRAAFPYEHDALILDTANSLTTISLVRRDLLVNVVEVPIRINDAVVWMEKISSELTDIAGRFPLPRTIFLLARESEDVSLQKALDNAKLGSLWLAENPPKIIALLASHLAGLVRHTSSASPDLSLLLMAFFHSHRSF